MLGEVGVSGRLAGKAAVVVGAGPAGLEAARVLGERGHRSGGDLVEATRGDEHAQQVGGRVRLDRIQGRAGKPVDEETRCAPRGVRAVEDDGFVRTEVANYSQCVRIDVQLKGPPIGLPAR